MKTKILSALKTKCKDMGVSDNALTELTEISATNLKTDATDEDINAAVDSLVPFAKAKSSCLCVKKSSDTSFFAHVRCFCGEDESKPFI